MELNYSLLIIF